MKLLHVLLRVGARTLLFVEIMLCPLPIFAIDFSISNPGMNDQEISFDAALSNVTTTNCPDDRCYLQGVLRSASSSKYFGESLNTQGNWVDYISNIDTEYIKANFHAADIQKGSWSAKLKVRFKADDPNYQGPGSYDLKVRRYTGKSSTSYAESNTITINLTATIPAPSPTATAVPTDPVPEPASTSTPTPTPARTPTPSKAPTPTVTVAPTPTHLIIASNFSVLGASNSPVVASSEAEQEAASPVKPLIISLLFVGIGCGILSLVLLWQKRDALKKPSS